MFLEKKTTGLWIMDIQDQLFPHIDRSCEVLERICFIIEAARALQLPLVVTEQYPEGLGETVKPIKDRLPEQQKIYSKSCFSGFPVAKEALDRECWILVGIEAHICILQTAKDLLHAGKKVVILNDAISSRSLYDFSTAMGELREIGARITSAETVIYELIRDASSPEFKEILPLIKTYA